MRNSEKQDTTKSCIFLKEDVQEIRLKLHRSPGKFTASHERTTDFFVAQIFTSGMDLPDARDIVFGILNSPFIVVKLSCALRWHLRLYQLYYTNY